MLERLNGMFAFALWDGRARAGCSSRATRSARSRSTGASSRASNCSSPPSRKSCSRTRPSGRAAQPRSPAPVPRLRLRPRAALNLRRHPQAAGRARCSRSKTARLRIRPYWQLSYKRKHPSAPLRRARRRRVLRELLADSVKMRYQVADVPLRRAPERRRRFVGRRRARRPRLGGDRQDLLDLVRRKIVRRVGLRARRRRGLPRHRSPRGASEREPRGRPRRRDRLVDGRALERPVGGADLPASRASRASTSPSPSAATAATRSSRATRCTSATASPGAYARVPEPCCAASSSSRSCAAAPRQDQEHVVRLQGPPLRREGMKSADAVSRHHVWFGSFSPAGSRRGCYSNEARSGGAVAGTSTPPRARFFAACDARRSNRADAVPRHEALPRRRHPRQS